MSSRAWWERLPYAGHERTSKYTSPLPSSAAYAWPFSTSVSIRVIISVMWPVARGSYVAGSTPSVSRAADVTRSLR